jgi:ribose transport system permease protein
LTLETFKKKVTGIGRKVGSINGIVIALILLIILVSIGSAKFTTWSNITNILRQAVPLGIMACMGVFVIIGGNIDLSVGSILSFTGLISCNLVGSGMTLAILVPIIMGAACGAFNGFLVGVLRFNPFISTLGTMSIFQAAAYFYSNNKFLTAKPNEVFRVMGQGYFLGIPIPVYILAAIFLIFFYILKKTTFGRAAYIVGGNPECAKYSGISYSKTTVVTYALSGMAAAVTAIILVARQMAAQPEMGQGYEFDVITAIVVGGVGLSGGKGTIWGALLGVLFIVILKNAFILLDIPLYYQYSVLGLILMLAVGLDVLSERRTSFGRKN